MSSKVQFAREAILRLREDTRQARIPAERLLAEQLGMNHRTVRRALEELVAEGVIEKRARVGSFFCESTGAIPLALVLPSYLLTPAEGQHLMVGMALDAIHDVLDHRLYQITTIPYRPDYFEEDAGQLILQRKIQGCLVVGHYRVSLPAVRKLMNAGVKIVLMTQHPALVNLGLPAIYDNIAPALGRLIDGLVERGRRRIAVVRYTQPRYASMDMALEMAARKHGLGAPDDFITWIANEDSELDFRAFDALIQSKNRPDAIVVPDEVVAGRLFREAYRHHVRIPDDLYVAAVTDLSPAVHPVPLTAPDSITLARKRKTLAAQELLELMTGKPSAPVEITVQGAVIWRESTGPCP